MMEIETFSDFLIYIFVIVVFAIMVEATHQLFIFILSRF